MAAVYSVDLRRKVLQACELGTQSQREMAELFNVSLSFVESLLRQYRRSGGELVPQRQKCGRRALLDDVCRAQLRQWLQKQPDLTLQELIDRLLVHTGIAVSVPTMCRVLHQMGMRRKKRSYTPRNGIPRICLARRQHRQQIRIYPVTKLKFIDESGLNIAMMRRYGRTPRGQRVHDAVPKNFGRNISILGALSWYGMNAVMTMEGAVDAAVFRAYVEQVLVPTLRAGDVVVMDNLSVHKAADIESLITGVDAQLIYLPPYSPDWSPIEPCWPKLKTWLRGMKARTRETLDLALTKVIGKISNSNAKAWFAHCRYPIH